MNFVIRLKATGMPIKEILQYSQLRELGETTSAARQELLEKHRENLSAKIQCQLEHLAALDHKITLYKLKKVS